MKTLRARYQNVNKKGAYSVITVMLALILVMSFTTYTDILQRSYVLNEVQQRLDTSGLNALNESIDTSRLRLEELAVHQNYSYSRYRSSRDNSQNRETTKYTLHSNFKNKIEQKYKEEVYQQIRLNDTVQKVQVKRVDISMSDSAWGTGEEGQKYPQLTLDAVIYLEVKNSKQFDLGGVTTDQFYDARSGTNFTIKGVNTNNKDVAGLLIRSSTRAVYR